MLRYNILILIFCFSLSLFAQNEQTVEVKTSEQLLAAIGSEKTILLVVDTLYLKTGINFDKVKNLSIKGSSVFKTKILSSDSNAYIFSFLNSSNIKLENIEAGHKGVKTNCASGVILLQNSAFITIQNCNLFGSGQDGISAQQVMELYVYNCTIYDCSEQIFQLTDVQNGWFENCTFRDNDRNQQSGKFVLGGCSYVNLVSCSVKNNITDVPLFYYASTINSNAACCYLYLTNCNIYYNKALKLTNLPETNIILSKVLQKNNQY